MTHTFLEGHALDLIGSGYLLPDQDMRRKMRAAGTQWAIAIVRAKTQYPARA